MSPHSELTALLEEIEAGTVPEEERLDAITESLHSLRTVEVEPVRDLLQRLLAVANAELGNIEAQLADVVQKRRGVRAYGGLKSGSKLSQRVYTRA